MEFFIWLFLVYGVVLSIFFMNVAEKYMWNSDNTTILNIFYNNISNFSNKEIVLPLIFSFLIYIFLVFTNNYIETFLFTVFILITIIFSLAALTFVIIGYFDRAKTEKIELGRFMDAILTWLNKKPFKRNGK